MNINPRSTKHSKAYEYKRMVKCGFSDRELLAVQQDKCWLCGLPMYGQYTRDHVVPKSKGATLKKNKLLAHGHCNKKRGNPDPNLKDLVHLRFVHHAAIAYVMAI